MSSNNLSKSEKFYNILKINGNPYIRNFTPNNFDYLFNIPETKPFFDWFLNINSNCSLTKEKIKEFKSKAERGQALSDLRRLENLYDFVNSRNDSIENQSKIYSKNTNEFSNDLDEVLKTDIDSIKRELERRKKELKLEQQSLNFYKLAKQKSLSLNKTLKTKIEAKNRFNSNIDDKESMFKNTSKLINQTLDKTSIEFRTKFGDEEKISLVNTIDEELTYGSNLINIGKYTISYIRNLMSIDPDCTDLTSLIKSSKEEDMKFVQEDLHNQKLFKLIMEKRVTKSIDRWAQSRLAYITASTTLAELKQIIKNTNIFFEFTAEQLKQNPSLRDSIEEKIKEFEKILQVLNMNYKESIDRMPSIVNSWVYLKMVNLVYFDMDNKLINLKLFLSKQEKLFKCLSYLTTLNSTFSLSINNKLNTFYSTKQIFEELTCDNKTANSLTSNPKSLLSTSISSGQSLMNSSVCSSNKNTTILSYNQFTTNANILSSTMALNSSSLIPFISSPNKPISSRFQAHQGIELTNDSAIIHTLNQFLILALTKFESFEEFNDDLFKLTNRVSINFNENLESYINLFNLIQNLNRERNNILKLENQVNCTYKEILKTIEYLYEKENKDDSYSSNQTLMNKTSSSGFNLNYNLSKIRIKMTKKLEEPLKKINEINKDLTNLFGLKIFQQFNHYSSLINTNKFIGIKRDFFVYFYTNPKQISHIMQILNQN